MSIKSIDREKCTGCGTCVNACPMDVIRRDFETPAQSPCTVACPAHINMRKYNHLVMLGRYEDAIEEIRKQNPLFAITGHVCFRPCETRCARQEVDEPVNINGIERYLSDIMLSMPAKKAKQIYCGKVAVVGSGPAGLTAAYELAAAGYPVTVFEKDAQFGGMLRTALPDYRMPKDVLDKQIQFIADTGVKFEANRELGKDFTIEGLKRDGFDAILIALGAADSKKSNVPGSDKDGVLWGLDFLKQVVAGEKVTVGKKTVVIGGGSVAIDAAMCAKRTGADSIDVYCLESRKEVPAHEEELRLSAEEGIQLHPGWSVREIRGGEGNRKEVVLEECVSVYDRTGRFNPSVNKDKTITVEAETIIFAIGQSVNLNGLPEEMKKNPARVKADPKTMETNVPGVFAAGIIVPDIEAGSVIGSIASAKEAAISIDRYLKGQDIREGRFAPTEKVHHPPKEGVELRKRNNGALLKPEERVRGFDEIRAKLDDEAFEREASRCMGCGSKARITYVDECQVCAACEHDCPNGAIYVDPEKLVEPLVAYR